MSADCRRENAATKSVLGVSGELEPGLETDKVPGPWLCPAPRSASQAHYDNVRDLSRQLVAYSQHLLFSSEHPRAKRSDTVDTVDTKESVVKERIHDL